MKTDAAQGGATVIRVLLVEDVATDAELEVRELRRAGLRVQHVLVDREPAFVAALREFRPDVIISDFSMPHFDGMAALALARELAPDTPFIFVSGTIGEEYAIRALKSGATDYVLKTNLVRLPAAVDRALQDSRERAARRLLATRGQPDLFGIIFRTIDTFSHFSWRFIDRRIAERVRRAEEGSYLVQEIRRGSFSRSVTLPNGLEPDKAVATFENGILTLRIPKAEQVKPRQIRISPVTDASGSRPAEVTAGASKA